MWRIVHQKLLPFVCLAIGCLAIMQCENSSGGGVEEGAEKSTNSTLISFRLDTLLQSSPQCASDSNRCATASLVFPYAESGPTQLCVDFNRLQLKYLKAMMQDMESGEQTSSLNLEGLMGAFLQDYAELLADDPPFSMPWAMEIEGEILFQNDKLITVQLEQYTFTGGAHPNSSTTIWMLDKKTGEPLELQGLSAKTDTLLPLAEVAFRKAIELPITQTLADAGYFQDEVFSLPANYGLVEEGLLLYYNTYEVAPYVLGPTAVMIPLADLQLVFETDNWY